MAMSEKPVFEVKPYYIKADRNPSPRKLELLQLQNEVDYPKDVVRPKTRGDCEGGVRPCVWVSCRWNLYLDVKSTGAIKINFPGREPHEMGHSCALDVADAGGETLNGISLAMNMTRERIRQIEEHAVRKFERTARALGMNAIAEGKPK